MPSMMIVACLLFMTNQVVKRYNAVTQRFCTENGVNKESGQFLLYLALHAL